MLKEIVFFDPRHPTPTATKFILIVYNNCNETESESKLKAMGGAFVLEIKHLKQDLWKQRAVGQ